MELFVVDVHGKINPVRVEETCEVDDFRNRVIPSSLNLGPVRGSIILPNGRRLEGKKTLKEEGVNNKGKYPVQYTRKPFKPFSTILPLDELHF